jgi:hypothetical protein
VEDDPGGREIAKGCVNIGGECPEVVGCNLWKVHASYVVR